MEKVVVFRFGIGIFLFSLIAVSLSNLPKSTAGADSLFQSPLPSSQTLSLEPQNNFLQVVKDASGKARSLETAVSTYKNLETGAEVTLVGAMHIADRQYFESINTELGKYPVVLYELVAPKDTKPVRQPEKSKNAYSGFQQTLGDLLDVEHQMDIVDYQKANFIHADLSMDDLIAEGKKRGETQFTFLMSMFLDVMKTMSKSEHNKKAIAGSKELKTFDDLIDLVSQPSELKHFLAMIFSEQGTQDGIPGLATINPYIIDLRNEAALKVLDQQLASGVKKIAIFYGAAHLPDFERRLISQYGMTRTNTKWLVAWDLTRESQSRDNPIVQWLRMMKAMQG